MLTAQKVCGKQRKICYPTNAAAIRAALSYSRKRGTPLRPYFHKECRSFHLTKRPKWGVDNQHGKASA